MNLRQVRKKVKAVGNVKKITRAMQLVSAVKMKKAQQEELERKPYSETFENMIRRVVTKVDPKISNLLSVKEKELGKELVILISSNKGLCGSFNFNLFRFCLKNIDFSQADFITIGKKGVVLINKMGGKIIADFSSSKPLTTISAVFNLSLSKFLAGEYSQVLLFYNKFISALNFEPVKEMILPVKLPASDIKKKEEFEEEYLIEPAPELILDNLLRTFVEEKIRGAIVSSEAGEHSARMVAMKNATDNASDLIYELVLLRNKLRQEKITYELLDMVTAKQSMESA